MSQDFISSPVVCSTQSTQGAMQLSAIQCSNSGIDSSAFGAEVDGMHLLTTCLLQ